MSDEGYDCHASFPCLDRFKTCCYVILQRESVIDVEARRKLNGITSLLKKIDAVFTHGDTDEVRNYLIMIDSLIPQLESQHEQAILYENICRYKCIVDMNKCPSLSERLANKFFKPLFLLIEFNAPKTRPVLDILFKVFIKVLFLTSIKSLRWIRWRRKFWNLVEDNLRLNCDFVQQHFFKIVSILVARLPKINIMISDNNFLLLNRLSKSSRFDEVSKVYNAYHLESFLINIPLWGSLEAVKNHFQNGNITKGMESLFLMLDRAKIKPLLLMKSNLIRLFKGVIFDAASKTFIDVNVTVFLNTFMMSSLCIQNFTNFVDSIRDVIDYVVDSLYNEDHVCPIHSGANFPRSGVYDDIFIESAELLQCLFVLNTEWTRWYDIIRPTAKDDSSGFLCPRADSTLEKLLKKITQSSEIDLFVRFVKTCPAALSYSLRSKLFEQNVLNNILGQLFLKYRHFKVSRKNVFQALKAISNIEQAFFYPWKFRFTDELGQGFGPTKEFYALAIREFQKHELGLWIGDPVIDPSGTAGNLKSQPSYTHSHNGLFPKTPEKKKKEEYVTYFNLLGKVMAKLFVDDRATIDIPLSVEFIRQAFSRADGVRPTKRYFELIDVMPPMTKFIEQLLKIKKCKEFYSRNLFISDDHKKSMIENMTFDEGCSFSDLCVYFTVPGTNQELKEGGSDIMLTASNLEEYLECLGRAVLEEGPSLAIQSFREGFSEVLPIEELSVFTPDELQLIFCGHQDDEPWTVEYLKYSCFFTNGYNVDSSQIGFLLELMASFNSEERRLFIKFVCSSPKLPAGGLVNLVPRLTVSRLMGAADDDDARLPCSSTCFNELRLPAYSSYEVTRQRVLFAINECRESFLIV